MNELRGNVFTPEVIRGKDGKSAYEIAKDKGFQGSEEQWIASLQPPKITTQLIPVFSFDKSGDIQGRIYDVETHVLLGWTFEDDNVEERTHKGIAEDNWFIPCYTSQNAYTHFYIGNNISTAITVVLCYKDGSFSDPEILADGWDSYIELSTDIEYIAIVGEWDGTIFPF